MKNIINNTICSTLFIYIFYLVSHLATNTEPNNSKIFIFFLLLISNFTFHIIRHKFPNKFETKFNYIIFYGIFGFGLNWFILMIDFMTTPILVSILLSSIAGIIFSILKFNINLIK